MNTYTTNFFSVCPVNGARINYRLRITTTEVIRVEDILSVVSGFVDGFHEDFADRLLSRFGGSQTLTADHHGVVIETTRTKQD